MVPPRCTLLLWMLCTRHSTPLRSFLIHQIRFLITSHSKRSFELSCLPLQRLCFWASRSRVPSRFPLPQTRRPILSGLCSPRLSQSRQSHCSRPLRDWYASHRCGPRRWLCCRGGCWVVGLRHNLRPHCKMRCSASRRRFFGLGPSRLCGSRRWPAAAQSPCRFFIFAPLMTDCSHDMLADKSVRPSRAAR